jgi:hypothetical protein
LPGDSPFMLRRPPSVSVPVEIQDVPVNPGEKFLFLPKNFLAFRFLI